MKKTNSSNSSNFTARDYSDFAKLALLAAFFIGGLVFMYKMTGFKVIGTLLGAAVLFSPMFFTPAARFCTSKRSRTRKTTDNSSEFTARDYSDLLKLTFLAVFFIGALVFMYKMTGFWVIGALLGMAALFSPMFLTKPAALVSRANMFLDPIYKGLTGNIFTKK